MFIAALAFASTHRCRLSYRTPYLFIAIFPLPDVTPSTLIRYWNVARRILLRHLAQMRSIHERNIISKRGETSYQKVIQDGDSSMTMEKCATARLTSAEQAAPRILPSSFIMPRVSYSTCRAISPLHFRLNMSMA